MAIGAHPDDIEFMMAGTLILLGQAGWTLHYMHLCDGRCGTAREEPERIVARRREEARAACALIGARYYEALAPDLQLEHTTATVARTVAAIRQARPAVLLLPSPQDYMEDHTNACRIGVTAAFARGMRNFPCDPPLAPVEDAVTLYHALPYGLRDGLRRRVRAGLYVDVTAVLPLKRRMLACHISQKEWLDRSQGLDAYLDVMEAMAREVGVQSGRFDAAEGWRRHSHLGFAPTDADPLCAALGARGAVDRRYETALE